MCEYKDTTIKRVKYLEQNPNSASILLEEEGS